jgi:hypothetical protein
MCGWLTEVGRVQLSLFLIKQHAMKMYGGMEVQLHVFLTSVQDEVFIT